MGEGPVVLVVDDDTFVREALGRLFLREGIRTVAAASPGEARMQLALHRATLRLVVVDLGLGNESGLDVVRELRQSASPPSILVFSAAAEGAARAQSLALGVDEILDKPASPNDILAATRRCLAGRNAGTTGEWMRTHPSRGCHGSS